MQWYIVIQRVAECRGVKSFTKMGMVKRDMMWVLWRVFAVCIVIVTRDVCCVGVIHTALCVVVECCA